MKSDTLEVKFADFVGRFEERMNTFEDKLDTLKEDVKNLKENFPTRDEVTARIKPLDKVQLTLYGEDGDHGLVKKVDSLISAKNWIWAIVAGYIIIASAMIGYGIYKVDSIQTDVFRHISQ